MSSSEADTGNYEQARAYGVVARKLCAAAVIVGVVCYTILAIVSLV